MYPHQW